MSIPIIVNIVVQSKSTFIKKLVAEKLALDIPCQPRTTTRRLPQSIILSLTLFRYPKCLKAQKVKG